MIPKLSRTTVFNCVNVILRVPALFLAEAWFRTDIKTVQHRYVDKLPNPLPPANGQTYELILNSLYYSAVVFMVALVVLPLKKLVNLYMYLVSAALLVSSHFLSYQYTLEEQHSNVDGSIFDHKEHIERLGINIALQVIISATIAYLLNLKQWTKVLLMIYTAPMLARMLNYPLDDLHKVFNFSSIFAILLATFYIFHKIPIVLDFVKSGIHKISIAVQLYGWIPFLLAVWLKILLPMQFLVFWLILVAVQIHKYFSVQNHPIFSEGWVVVGLASVAECCVTPVSLLGLCTFISYISYVVLTLTKVFLQGREAFRNDNMMHNGWTEGCTMFLLALQTGLIELKTSHRVFLMSVVLFIVISSLVQSMYEITEPILLGLGASQSKSYVKHLRTVALCTFLWMFPLYMTYIISQFFDLDFWLLVVISSCVLTSVQVLGSMLVYTLFIYDAIQQKPWENLDDIIYYAKASTRVMEFVVAVFVVAYGVRESVIGDWSWFNSSILIVHCYFNVWQRLQSGWKSFLLRREAMKKIEQMREATQNELIDLRDVCAICFQEMKTAKVTPCHHFYHSLCLRKWLYVQETCPLCHEKLHDSSSSDESDSDSESSDSDSEEEFYNTEDSPVEGAQNSSHEEATNSVKADDNGASGAETQCSRNNVESDTCLEGGGDNLH